MSCEEEQHLQKSLTWSKKSIRKNKQAILICKMERPIDNIVCPHIYGLKKLETEQTESHILYYKVIIKQHKKEKQLCK